MVGSNEAWWGLAASKVELRWEMTGGGAAMAMAMVELWWSGSERRWSTMPRSRGRVRERRESGVGLLPWPKSVQEMGSEDNVLMICFLKKNDDDDRVGGVKMGKMGLKICQIEKRTAGGQTRVSHEEGQQTSGAKGRRQLCDDKDKSEMEQLTYV